MNTLSVCMIIKNEEDTLQRILSQVKEFADELIIVDTGSTDNSIEIAKSFTDKVFCMQFVDFSTCRNYSLAKATCDYIMWLDADDFIPAESIAQLKDLKNSLDNVDMVMMPYQTAFDEEDNPTFTYYRERIFKRDKGYTFQGAVHEAITPSGNIVYKDIPIRHKKTKPATPLRNLNIYQNLIAKGLILNNRELFYYANELYYNNMHLQALTIYKTLQNKRDVFMPNLIQSFINCSNIMLDYGEYNQAFDFATKPLMYILPTPTIYCQIGYVLHKWKKYNLSNYYYSLATTCKENDALAFVNTDYQEFVPYLQIALNYYLMGDMDNAVKYNSMALEIKPYSTIAKENQKIYLANKK